MTTTLSSALPGLTIFSSQEEITKGLRKKRVLHEWDYLKDRHFQNSVVPLRVKSLDDVQAFLAQLDAHNEQWRHSNSLTNGCSKAKAIRHSLSYKLSTSAITPLSWAITSIARARRVCCTCHETGSFAFRDIPEYLQSC